MINLKDIKQEREESSPKNQFKMDLTHRINYIINNTTRTHLLKRNSIIRSVGKKYKFILKDVIIKTKSMQDIPPFCLGNFQNSELINEIIEISGNRYLNYAADFKDISYCNYLYSLNPDIDDKKLSRFSFSTLIEYEFLKEKVKADKCKIAEIESMLNTGNYPAKHDLEAKLLKHFSEKISFRYSGDRNKYIENLCEKIKLDYLIDVFSKDRKSMKKYGYAKNYGDFNKYFCILIMDSWDSDIFRKHFKIPKRLRKRLRDLAWKKGRLDEVLKKPAITKKFLSRIFSDNPEFYMKQFRITRKEFNKAKKNNSIYGLITKKMDRHASTLFRKPKGLTWARPSKMKDYVGMEVRVNGAYQDDYCKSKFEVPNGTLGVVNHVTDSVSSIFTIRPKKRLGKILSSLDDDYGFYVRLRNMKPVNELNWMPYSLTDKYRITKELEKAVFDRDYDALAKALVYRHYNPELKRIDRMKKDERKYSEFIDEIEKV